MQLIVFSSPELLPKEPALLTAVLDRGLQVLHLRKPGLSRRQYEGILASLSSASRAKLVLHDHHDLAARWDLKGVHYTERARAEAGRIQAWPGLTISTALHRLEQLQQEHGSLDYAFLSPIFDSISKAGYSAAFDHKELSAAVAQAPMPVYALGGIERHNIQQARALHFSADRAQGGGRGHRGGRWAFPCERGPGLLDESLEYVPNPCIMQTSIPGQKSFFGTSVRAPTPRVRVSIDRMCVANKVKKTDLQKQGISGVVNDVVRQNLSGLSKSMEKKGWTDTQGRKGKGFGVYRFAKKYGANVDGYSPIYTPDTWSESGGSYSLGTRGLIAWAGLVVIVLGVGITLVLSTSQLGQ
ncbi:hypothetical protein WJX84_008234 [Apatococcus fuscideae]|uniref:Thiamine phosphate synthase/TenI domain-containing protein n=1 Tax=Apatococcus fuscideae TaxID=2026836 RepID=A0AAW1T6C1_9CHLO